MCCGIECRETAARPLEGFGEASERRMTIVSWSQKWFAGVRKGKLREVVLSGLNGQSQKGEGHGKELASIDTYHGFKMSSRYWTPVTIIKFEHLFCVLPMACRG